MNINIDLYNITFFVLLAFAAWCVWKISVADWRRRIIPDVYLFPLLLTGMAVVIFFPWPGNPAESTLAAIFGYFLALIIGEIFEFINRKKNNKDVPIGMGDIKLISVGGIWLGLMGLAIALVLACVSGMIWGALKKQKTIPFAPFFIGSGILSLIIISFLL